MRHQAQRKRRMRSPDGCQRALNDTWFIDEVMLAVQKFYEVIVIFEMYEYVVTLYETQKRRSVSLSSI